jgi:ABC-type Fe3+-hydroxamate transport system substrate-binding protein
VSQLRKLLLLASAAALVAFATACGGSSDSTQGGDAAGFPVTVSTCGHSATFDEPPKRAVATDVNMIEAMLALDLGHLVVGTFAVGDNTHKIGEQYREAWNEIEHVSPTPTRRQHAPSADRCGSRFGRWTPNTCGCASRTFSATTSSTWRT